MAFTPVNLLKGFQRRVYDDPSRFIAWVAGRQIGKSFTGAMRAVKLCDTTPKRDFLVASPSERQSLEAVEKCRQHIEAFNTCKIAEEIVERDAPGALMKSSTIVFANGSRIIAVPGKPDTVRGFSADIWMDEFAFFEDPAATWKAILPSISNPLKGLKTAFLTSTPNGKAGRGKRFYDIVSDKGALDPAQMPPQYMAGAWSIHRTPITLAAPELGTDLDALREAVDDDETWKQEFLALFIDGSSVLLPYDVMAKCESMEAGLSVTPEEMALPGRGPWYAGIDFGRTSDPSVLWLFEKVGDVLWTRAVKVLKNENTVDQFEMWKPYIAECARVCVDYTGPGVGFGDMLDKAFHCRKSTGTGDGGEKVELCVFTQPFKAEIFPKLRTAFDGMRLRVPFDVDCREDLHEMQQAVSNGTYSYTAPRTAQGHSDRCTALALAVRAASGATAWTFTPVAVAPGIYEAEVPAGSRMLGMRDESNTRRLD